MQPIGSSPWQPWETGKLLLVDENGRSIVAHTDGASLPSGTCADKDIPRSRKLRLVPT
jgi:hypothetical protein